MLLTAPASDLLLTYTDVRSLTEALASPLSPEDQTAQSMPDASPTKWHRAHTAWFFEEFVLGRDPHYVPYDASYRYLFNSYYDSVGARHPRPQRGLITRPGLEEVTRYRRHVDEWVVETLSRRPDDAVTRLVELGCHHEQQHQELLLMDLKHLLSLHAFEPVYVARPVESDALAEPLSWRAVPGGVYEIGHDGTGFGFDNEGPVHRVILQSYDIAERQVTNGEWMAFVSDGGYSRPELWLSDGWHQLQAERWQAPAYWQYVDGAWTTFTLSGRRPVRVGEPVCHVSFYEADAFARWSGARLPSEQEWEIAARAVSDQRGALLDPGRCHPGVAAQAMVGDVWEWTASGYLPYPGFRPAPGAVGEYNGKFMCDQHVLRGASALTPPGHERITYRNFFPAAARWALSGLRLARS